MVLYNTNGHDNFYCYSHRRCGIWYINFAARATRLVCNSPLENRSVIEPRPSDNIYLHLNEISAAAGPTRYNNNYYYYWDIVGVPFWLVPLAVILLLPVDIRWPVQRETYSTDGRPVTRENTSDAIFRSIGFHGPKPRARVIIIIIT